MIPPILMTTLARYVTPRLIKWLALGLALLVAVGVIYYAGNKSAKQAAEIAALRSEVSRLETERKAVEAARAKDTILAKEQAVKIWSLKDTAKEIASYAETSPDGGRRCLDSSDTERLRDLWK